MKAVQYVKSVPRYLILQATKRWWPKVVTSVLAPTKLRDVEPPSLPTQKWVRIRTRMSGICGSDVATVAAKGSAYFSPLISTPFVYGHENVGDVFEMGTDVDQSWLGRRVVIEPALTCVVRGIEPVCVQCANGQFANCENVTQGDIAPGIQTGYCFDTGGGWSSEFVAHEWQLHPVPDEMSDVTAVLIEPFSCALHGALRADVQIGQRVLVLGCGTIGLLTIAALRALGVSNEIAAVAKYPHQERLATDFGADVVLKPGKTLYDKVLELYGAQKHQPELGRPIFVGGAEVVFDCVGSSTSIDDALRFTRAQGTTVLVGMPAIPSGIDWTAIWYKELRVVGAYAYGTENINGHEHRTFEIATQLLSGDAADKMSGLVGGKYRIADFRKAIHSALFSGKSGVAKTVFTFLDEE